MNCNSIEVNKVLSRNKNELGIARFVHHEDTDHYLYHQDGFNRDSDHYHAQFKNIINEAKLEEILTILEKYSIISQQEHKSFMNAYQSANHIPANANASPNTSANIVTQVGLFSTHTSDEAAKQQQLSSSANQDYPSDECQMKL